MKVLCSLFFIGFTYLVHAQSTLTPEILWSMHRVSGGTVSPDGNYLLYSQRTFDMAANKGNTDLFVIDLKSNKIKQITETPFSEFEAQWGLNNTIWFLSTEKDGLQIWRMDQNGNAKTQCSNFENVELEGFKVSPDESVLVTIEAIKVRQTINDKYPDLPKANVRLEDDLMYRHWDHFDDYNRRHLFVHNIYKEQNGVRVEPRGVDVLFREQFDGILPPHGGSEQFCFTNDSKKIIYTSKKLQGKEFAQSTNSELYEYSIDTKKTLTLTEAYKGYDNNPAFSSTGQLAWLSMARNGFEADKNDIIVRDASGKDKNLTQGIDMSISSFSWHPSGKSLYFIAGTKGTEHIFELDPNTGKHRQVTSGQFDYLSISIFGDNIYCGRQSMVAPTDLFVVGIKKGKVTQLTQANDAILKNLTLPKVEERWVETTDGKRMLVWMVMPPNFDPAKKYPALLYCQGGPQSQVSQFFSYRWNLALMASQGYIVVAPNRRGLPGFGQEWNDAISKDWGGQAMKDYLVAIDNVAQEPYVDETRLGAVGASYGGYSVYMLAGIHENRFKTFISHCGLFNLESWYGTTEELFFANWDQGGPYWIDENKENYKKNSPHNYVANWNTPILVIHGGMDFRVPESEGMQAFQAAQLKGLKSKYLYFPIEGHWVQSPQNGLVWQREFFEWLKKTLNHRKFVTYSNFIIFVDLFQSIKDQLMWHKIANFILKNRFFILGVITLLTVFFGYYAATSLRMENKYGIILPKESPTTQNYNRFKEKFGEDGGTLVLAIQTDSLYTETNFRKWKELGDSILQMDGVESVISEATLFTIRNNKAESKFDVQRIFSDVTFNEKSIDSIRKEIRRNPLYNKMLYNDSSHVSLMMVGLDERFLTDRVKSKVVFDIQKLANSFEEHFGEFHYAGLPYLRVVIAKRIQSEMYIFIGLSMLVSSILMYFFFRSFRAVLICMTVVGVSVIWAMGTIATMGYAVSVMMALIPPLMIVIGIPNCIYLYNKYHQEYRHHGNRVKALTRVVSKTGIAMFLTNVTTALGFITFLFTSSEKFFEFGVISSINIMLCYVVSLCLIPIFASFLKNPPERHLKHLDRKLAVGLLEKLVVITAKRRRWIYAVTIVITAVASVGMFKMTVTGNVTGDLPKNDIILKDIHFMETNFGGAVPFEVMIDYKEKGRLFGKNTLSKVEEVQAMLSRDSLFAKSISIVDFVKVINMAYYDNDPDRYTIISNRDKVRLSKYIDNFNMTNNNSTFSIKELVDTSAMILRVRTQMKDLGSYEVTDEVEMVKTRIDSIMNPDRKDIERLYAKVQGGKQEFIDSLLENYSNIYNSLTAEISQEDSDLQYKFDTDTEHIKTYYAKPEFNGLLRKSIDKEYYDITLTGTAVVVSEGTQYLIINLVSSIVFAIISIAALMSLLFASFRMVVISMIPNLIPMVITAGIMGWFGIPLKPSTLLIFSIALGITVDNTIHFLAKYRQELKLKKWDLKECVAMSIRETGLSIIYTSVILFFGFIVFVFSDFGGTQALGYLSAITYFVALFTNLVLLPALLLSLERRLATRSFEEPYFDAYSEANDLDWEEMQFSIADEEPTKDADQSETTDESKKTEE